MFNIVLVNPQIPQNTGAIGRMCVNANFALHIIKPTVFDLDEKAVKRAGLDYWDRLNLTVWESLEDFWQKHSKHNERMFIATTKTNKLYCQGEFKPDDWLIFGCESHGVPEWFMQKISPNLITIPMCDKGRSLNLAMSVGIVAYEALRQNLDKFEFRNSIKELF